METTNPNERLKQLLPQLLDQDRPKGERYLLWEITPELKAAINLNCVWEATVIPTTALTPIPLMPSWVLGWHSGRDRVYSVISLGEFLDVVSSSKIPQQYPTVVLQIPSRNQENQFQLLGVAVDRILRTVTIPSEKITSSVEGFPNSLTPYLKGSFTQDQQLISLLDLDTITDHISF